ncbi:MAG TPA: PelD GGDEF domain-containing protein, partial [Terriglobia bacterium]|nr:PelD GGDEF domain-containing protein [Terriglobia bacterium]
SAYLACVPLIAESGKLRGVLVIRRMPFLSLNLDNLQLLLVLFDYYTDGVEQNTLIAAVQQAVPECPFEFALELGRLGRMRQISGVCSSLVALVFPRGAIGESLYDQTLRQHRALDLYWTYDIEQVRVILILIPLADDNGVNGYLLRLEDNFWKQFDTDLAEAHVAVHSAGVDSVEPGIGLQKLLERCQHHG